MLSSDFHCKENDGSLSYPYTQDLQHMLDYTNSDSDFMNTIITGDVSWIYGYDPETMFHHFPYNGNLTRALNTTSLKCCLPSTDAIDSREKVQGRLMQARFIEIKQVFEKKKS